MNEDEKTREKEEEEERKKVEEAILNLDRFILERYRQTHPQTDPSKFGYSRLPKAIAPQKNGSGSSE